MRTGLIIAEFEMSFGSSFKHTAREMYGVDFSNSNIKDNQEKLKQLQENMKVGIRNDVHVGLQIALEEVERVDWLLNELVNRYKQHSLTLPKKINTLLGHLREFETKTPQQMVKEALNEILSPTSPEKKLTRKQRIEEEAKKLSFERAMITLKKSANKKGTS